jgi:hypothetical protein
MIKLCKVALAFENRRGPNPLLRGVSAGQQAVSQLGRSLEEDVARS